MVGVTGSIPVAPTISSPSNVAPRARGQATESSNPGTTAFMNGKGRSILRILAGLLPGLALLAAAVFPPGAAVAQQGVIKDKHGDWETRCETPPGAAYEQCAIVLSVVDQERPNLTLVVIVLNTADRKARLMRVIAPLGVLLPPGVGLRIDDQDFGPAQFSPVPRQRLHRPGRHRRQAARQAEDRQDRDARHLPDARAGGRRARAARRLQGSLRAIAMTARA